MADDTELKIGGYTFRFVHLAFALPILSGVAGGAYWGYDVLNRFLDVESGFEEVLGATSRIQALEQTVGDNDVANLASQLAKIGTNMETILEQQKTLLDLRSKVERAELITNGIGDKLERLKADIDSTWLAIDALEKPL